MIWKILSETHLGPPTGSKCVLNVFNDDFDSADNPQNFFPTVVKTLGFNRTITLVLTCPPYLIAGFITIAVSWSSGKFNERTWHITISKSVATVGFVAAFATLNLAGRCVAMVIFTIGTYGVNSLILGWCASVCGQTKEKKAAAVSIVTTIMAVSYTHLTLPTKRIV